MAGKLKKSIYTFAALISWLVLSSPVLAGKSDFKDSCHKAVATFSDLFTRSEEPRPRFLAPPDKPHLLGLARDKSGKLVPYYSASEELASIRDFRDLFILFNTWNPLRRMEIIPLDIKPRKILSINKTSDFKSVPKELRNLFSRGNILVTSKTRGGAESGPGVYSVLMPVVPNHNKGATGRTGFLMKHGVPMTVEIAGKEYLIEIKGIGNPNGGYEFNDKKLNLAIRGGLLESEAYREQMSLEIERSTNPNFKNGNTTRSAGYLVFDSPVGNQAYLIRLAPGSIRASFQNKAELTHGESKKANLIKRMTEIWIDFIARGLMPASHLENLIMVDDFDDYIPTDYSDIIPIGRFPTVLDGRKIDADTALFQSLNAISEIEGFNSKTDFQIFNSSLINKLRQMKKLSPEAVKAIEQADGFGTISQILWKEFVALEYFRQKKMLGSIPTELEHYEISDKSLNPDFIHAYLIDYLKKQLSYKRRYAENDKETADSLRREELRLQDEVDTIINSPKQYLDEHQRQYGWRMEDYHFKAVLQQRQGWLRDIPPKIKKVDESTAKHEKEAIICDKLISAAEAILAKNKTPNFDDFLKDFDSAEREVAQQILSEAFGENSGDSDLIIYILEKEIKFLTTVDTKASSQEKEVIAENIKIARDRIEELKKFDPISYLRLIQIDPDYFFRMIMLPYHSSITLDPDLSGRPWYRFLDRLPITINEPSEGKVWRRIGTKILKSVSD